jgi:hypothetical protein
MPYIVPFALLLKSKCKVTERKAVFPIGSRNLAFTSLIYMVFTYGVAMPTLFYLSVLAEAFQHIVDKILITYYFKAVPSHDTVMSYKIIKSIKYSVVPFLTIGSFIVTVY